MNKYEEALDNAIREFEIDLALGYGNKEFIKREIEDLKETKNELEKLRKAIDVLKNRVVDISSVKECICNYAKYKFKSPLEKYNSKAGFNFDNDCDGECPDYLSKLTEEEFKALQEVFENDL